MSVRSTDVTPDCAKENAPAALTEEGMTDKAEQARKESSPTIVTPGAVSVASFVQPAKALAPIVVQVDGRMTVVRFEHPANADSGISVMDVAEKSMLVSVVQPASAPSAMSLTVDATVADVGLS